MTGICPSFRVEISKEKIKKPTEGMKALKGLGHHVVFCFLKSYFVFMCFIIQVSFSEHLNLSLFKVEVVFLFFAKLQPCLKAGRVTLALRQGYPSARVTRAAL